MGGQSKPDRADPICLAGKSAQRDRRAQAQQLIIPFAIRNIVLKFASAEQGGE